MEKKRVIVGLSGGLDSTYTAMRYRDLGYDVVGVYLQMSDGDDSSMAKTAADQLGIPLYCVDARADFERYVKQYLVTSYAHGRTPNPCVMCNRYVKIAKLCEVAQEQGIDLVSTGHYAHICCDETTGRYYVKAAEDKKKDQSYVLWQLTQKMLSRLTTPMADLQKEEIREDALRQGILAATARESQDICFLPNGDYVSFVESRLGPFPHGKFLDQDGKTVGEHQGIIRYTVGQRKGLGVALGQPMFVTDIDPVTNTVMLAPSGAEYMSHMRCSDLVYQKLAPEALQSGLRVSVKIRYAAKPADAVISSIDNDILDVCFDTPQRAVTPGQSAVFYDPEKKEDILFGGWIEK